MRSELEEERLAQSEAFRAEKQRHFEESSLLGKGSFFHSFSLPVRIVMLTVAGIAEAMLLIILVSWISTPGSLVSVMGLVLLIILIAAIAGIGIAVFKIYKRGETWQYEANGREFTVIHGGKNGPVDHIFYKDVEGVEYKPFKMLWFPHGYHVTVKMKSGFSYRYHFLYPENRKNVPTTDLPFEIIRQCINIDK